MGSANTTLIISNEEMNDIIKLVQALEDSNILLKGVIKTIINETKEQKGGFLRMLLGTSGDLLTGKGIVRGGTDNHSLNEKEWDPLTNFEIQKYYQNEPRFDGVYSKDNLQKLKDGAYIINLDEYSDIRTHWFSLHVNNNDVTYFDSFRVEHIPKEIKTLIIKTLKQTFLEYKHTIQ